MDRNRSFLRPSSKHSGREDSGSRRIEISTKVKYADPVPDPSVSEAQAPKQASTLAKQNEMENLRVQVEKQRLELERFKEDVQS